MRNAGEHALGSPFLQDIGGSAQGAGGFRHVVNQNGIAPFHVTNDIHGFHMGGVDAVLGNNGQFRTQRVGIRASHFHAAHVRGDDDQFLEVFNIMFAQVTD